ncbi:dephospho-CoA kinase [Marinibactrum halimedae]|uniref:Dephospho-CoA kinase n=1 Tax=Marinibactrum halimedae TaxID=1444977 RepID=A0AA37WQC9_9GAMM|nr:dephospho-CoA kinase [Marinibactrum halimedae]MCD9460231.1 dephospho-CoA kinase [Marinibactrum halimedae]GLS27936.1 dephospho-CoA kinase [Marinibactrum halimedae]
MNSLQPLKIGLTGGIGSGKSAVVDQFIKLGIPVMDADDVARDVVAPGEPALESIFAYFGEHLRLDNGELNRKALRELVFTNKDKKTWLEQLLHPLIRQRISTFLNTDHPHYCVLASPLLIETQQTKMVDKVVVVDVPVEVQLQRTVHRDGSNQELVQKIIDSQIDRTARCKQADFILDNRGSFDALAEQVKALHEQLVRT